MLTIDIPGISRLEIAHLVLDYNGTIAADGELIAGVAKMIGQLSIKLTVHVLTADTHGTVAEKVGNLPCTLHIIPPGDQDKAKLDYIRNLGCEKVAAVGNGRNDRGMLTEAALGIGLIQTEGASPASIQEASVVCLSIQDALQLLLKPSRLQATLRN